MGVCSHKFYLFAYKKLDCIPYWQLESVMVITVLTTVAVLTYFLHHRSFLFTCVYILNTACFNLCKHRWLGAVTSTFNVAGCNSIQSVLQLPDSIYDAYFRGSFCVICMCCFLTSYVCNRVH